MEASVALRNIEKILEINSGTLRGNEPLASLPAWDSLAVLGFIALADKEFGMTLNATAIAGAHSVKDLVGLLSTK